MFTEAGNVEHPHLRTKHECESKPQLTSEAIALQQMPRGIHF